MVAPLWPTQCWYPVLNDLLIRTPLILPRGILSRPHSREKHPLHKKLTLKACRLSGTIRTISRKASDIIMASWRPGTKEQLSSYIRKWISFTNKRKISAIQVPVDQVLEFVTELFDLRIQCT